MDGRLCNYNRQINEKVLDEAVVEIICQMVKKPKFIDFMKERISLKVDMKEMDREIEHSTETLKKAYKKKNALLSEIDLLDMDDKHYKRKKNDLSLRLDKLYDEIEEIENSLEEAKRRKKSLENNKISSDNIYKILMNFDQLYSLTSNQEKHLIIESLINRIEIHENKKENGQWLKAIYFNIPLIREDLSVGLDNLNTVETVALLYHQEVEKTIYIDYEHKDNEIIPYKDTTYEEIKAWIKKMYGFNVTNLYIGQAKEKFGLAKRKTIV